jgi:hypothetical protein
MHEIKVIQKLEQLCLAAGFCIAQEIDYRIEQLLSVMLNKHS